MFENIEKVLTIMLLKNRLCTSAYKYIFQELRLKDKEEFRRYLRMNSETCQVKLFICLFICLDIILRIEKLLITYLITFFIAVNIPIMLMELFDFIYHEKFILTMKVLTLLQ